MAAYRRVDDLRSPAGWLPVHRDQLQAQRSVSSMGKPLPFYTYVSGEVTAVCVAVVSRRAARRCTRPATGARCACCGGSSNSAATCVCTTSMGWWCATGPRASSTSRDAARTSRTCSTRRTGRWTSSVGRRSACRRRRPSRPSPSASARRRPVPPRACQLTYTLPWWRSAGWRKTRGRWPVLSQNGARYFTGWAALWTSSD